MSFKIVCYGVRPNEVETFNNFNKYGYDLVLLPEYLTHENVETAKGADALLLRGNCVADERNLKIFAQEYGIKYVFTRTVGFNHIDLEAAKKLGVMVARVPAYSPNSVAELSLTLAMMLLRHTAHTVNQTSHLNFVVDPKMFSKEIRNCTVGILGLGRIGLTEAKLFKGLGAKVIGYDVFQSDAAKEVVEFMEMDQLLAESDIVSIHVPYFAGQNDDLVNADFISKMKDGAILINTARGELQDNKVVIDAIKSGKLDGFATDVIKGEKDVFFKEFKDISEIKDETIREFIDLYPRVLVTPHVGSNTDEALKNMVEISMDNFNDVLTTGKSQNLL